MPKAAPAPARPVVVSIGGSVLPVGEGAATYWGELAQLLRTVGARRPLAVTVGGGRTARDYIRLGRDLGLTEIELDEVGIEVTRLHARLLAAAIGPTAPIHPPATIALAVHELRRTSPVVLGGTEPGHTTDGVAALLAARLRAERLVNATNVAGVFDRDPQRAPTARRLDRLSWARFREMVHAGASGEAGQSFLFDQLGVEVVARARVPVCVVDGRDLKNLGSAMEGRPFEGTRVEG
ncbi:MAG TPA: UMP kinase [Thermoplasmata archaeon]|nr:UMP kinase [Thermoplasmata archaeon]